MKLLDQNAKKIMEGCKERARDVGLNFDDNTLEYVVTNRDMLELNPKIFIPTMYDYWVHDVGAFAAKKEYEIYPNNPFETVINGRPAMSFYNDNNPDWLNAMIFYHVLGHIDFFQNNKMFKNTWDRNFILEAESDKRYIENLRNKHGRKVDYVIEFSRSLDNLVGYFDDLNNKDPNLKKEKTKFDFYFNNFLQSNSDIEFTKEIERYNKCIKQNGKENGEDVFFGEVYRSHPGFNKMFEKYSIENSRKDIMEYIRDNSEFLNKSENEWMKGIMNVVRRTSLYFQPQIRTKILNEGWASYWHEHLFIRDERINGNEVKFSKINSSVLSFIQGNLNPYALGINLFKYVEELANKGKMGLEYEKNKDEHVRKTYNKKTGKGREHIFNIRENLSDHLFLNKYIDQDFVNKHKLYVMGERIGWDWGSWGFVKEYYIKSRKAEDYKKMVLDTLYHPPHVSIDKEKAKSESVLYLNHLDEGKPLLKQFIPAVLEGIQFLWGEEVKLETTLMSRNEEGNINKKRALYSIDKNKKIGIKEIK
jgi:stage V sporulation protein R